MEKKEIGKLLELLNEYEQLNMCRKFKEYDIENQNMFENDFVFIKVSELISKRYGFIKWLVENDKIDRTFRENVRYPYYLEKGGLLQGYEKSDVITMILSISDEPIESLISILK